MIFVDILAHLKTQTKLDDAEMLKKFGGIFVSVHLEEANN